LKPVGGPPIPGDGWDPVEGSGACTGIAGLAGSGGPLGCPPGGPRPYPRGPDPALRAGV